MILSISNKNHLNNLGGFQSLADTFHDVCILSTNNMPKDFDSSAKSVIDCRINRLTSSFYRYANNEELCYKLVDLKNEIKSALNQAHINGKCDGQNLLKQLNKGDITLKDFEL